jgi:SAM-dependent methyltransferase
VGAPAAPVATRSSPTPDVKTTIAVTPAPASATEAERSSDDAAPPSIPPPAALPSDLEAPRSPSGGVAAARGSAPKRNTRPPIRRSQPPPPAHVIVPTDVVPSPSKPTPAPAIQVMRIIAIGAPAVEEPPPEVAEDDVEEIAREALAHDAPIEVEVEIAVPPAPPVRKPPAPVASEPAKAREDEATELADEDLAPDSQEGRRASALARELELEREDALSVPPDEPAAPSSDHKSPVPPPPPPRRQPAPDRISSRPRAKKLKRPWWEELFAEDFTRSMTRLSDKQVAREVDFIEESLGVAPGGVVLDLACGAGYHAVELASRGYGVVGYDLSVYQLALAADVAQERNQKINFMQGDMREMAFEETFDGIYCWNTSFGYFEEEKNLAVLQRIFKALKPGGMLLLDVANRDFAAMYSPNSLWYEGDSCVCMDDMSVDFITGRLRVKRSVILDDGRSRECSYSIRIYSLHELGKLLHDVGFRVAEASGHPSTPGVFFGQHSPRLIVLSQRP